MDDGMEIKFWGTRGSLAAPFADRMAYGGNTSCVSVRWKYGIAVFDGGTGMVAFGKSLEAAIARGEWDRSKPVFVFVSHVHLDHVAGIPMIPCLFHKEAFVELFGPARAGEGFRQRLSRVLGPPYWPVAVDGMPGAAAWHDVGEETQWILRGGVKVFAMKANHPDGGYIYRREDGGQSLVYGLDCELGGPGTDFWNRYREFAKNCSLLVFDSPYGEEEYPSYRGFGHSYWQQGIRMAGECRAGRLVISHHDWGRTDGELRAMEQEAVSFGKSRNVDTVFAREGACLFLESFKRDGDGGEAG